MLPKDISKQNMVNIMRLFSIAIGQRCSFCHVATDDLSKADFAADDKETKRKIRDLLKAILEAQKASAK
ncbi:MAG: hypothetical protein HY646_13655 [Acidobacteria bacterium]|nr:hypothetical protein [Acidobacteriota bacterium]